MENSEDPLLLRGVYMILFYVLLAFSRFVVGVIAAIQFLHALLTGELQEDLKRFSGGLTRFITHVVAYLTFEEEKKPFPFSEWPSDRNIDKGES